MSLYMRRLTHAASTLALGLLVATGQAGAGTYDLTIGQKTINVSGQDRPALAINGAVPGPTLGFKEGEDIVIRVPGPGSAPIITSSP